MSVCDAPQWLESEWLRSCRDVGVTVREEQVEETGRRLLNRWCRADRHFHNIRHLADVLQRIDEMAPELQRPAFVRLAAFYHGVVFTTKQRDASEGRGGEDEMSSAALAESELLGLGVPPKLAARVAALVMALHDKMPHPGDGDCAALRDAEMATLAVEPQRYADYVRELAEEFRHIDRREFLVTRMCVLRALLMKDSIFRTPHGEQWEAAARQNIGAELQRVSKELDRLDRAEAATSAGPGQDSPAGAEQTAHDPSTAERAASSSTAV